MANKPIRFEFVAEVAQYLRETKKLEVSTEDIANALLAVSNSSGDLERKLGKAMRDAEKDVDALTRAIKDLPDATDRAADAAGKDFKRLGDDAREAGREVGDEFKQNLGESLASGDLGDLFADTIGGLISSLKGPVGAAAAVVGTGALLIFNKMKEDYQQTIDAMNTAAQTLVEKQLELGRQYLFQTERLQAMQDIVKEDPQLWGKVRVAAEEVGFTLEDVMNGMLGSTAEADAFRRKLQDAVKQGTDLGNVMDPYDDKLTPAAAAASELLGYLNKGKPAIDQATEAIRNQQSVLGYNVSQANQLAAAFLNARNYANGIERLQPLVGRGPSQRV